MRRRAVAGHLINHTWLAVAQVAKVRLGPVAVLADSLTPTRSLALLDPSVSHLCEGYLTLRLRRSSHTPNLRDGEQRHLLGNGVHGEPPELTLE
jgi:hypothetical protein